ncbi:MAG: glycoside hydrolase family 99-like domain-containing protein [Kofleriaceae bacterium]|nr:glycoside hydrolase family 99-like domain-containing protein [Kofleriaceae bacterium]MBP6838581.1 glycoside hydrolase family 99-like domain-containing protein [Kofleriaceae bacterium]MBP9203051.1 glycoside hydrolase family 99-like domain-containing protein [Kofleriaceae bacterium]
MRVLAYVYPGWHPIPERDASFYPGFTEWDLVEPSRPRFDGHEQPRLPLWGRYDDRDPVAVQRRIELCQAHGVDGWIYGAFWCRGKRVFEQALDLGFLGSAAGQRYPFGLMWANRMPRRVLPVRRTDTPVIEDDRLVRSDVDDFVAFVRLLAAQYFHRANYLRVDGRLYFSIFDSTFFVRELGRDGTRAAISAARAALREVGLPDLYLTAIEPADDVIGEVRALGFDAVSHYVLLPDWKGEFLQDYDERMAIRAAQWPGFAERCGLPYHPSVTPGWDASPRAAEFAEVERTRPTKYPWSPVVVGEHPARFRAAVARAIRFAAAGGQAGQPCDAQLVFIASLNEWSEGHYLEPDTRFGLGWIEAVRDGRVEGESSDTSAQNNVE